MDDKSYFLIPKKWVRTGLVVAVTALIVAPLAAVASHSFDDVPDTNTFHDDIAWLADAGVTRGCNPPENTEFCPDDNVTREQMAAFMRRFAQYLDAEDGTPAQADHATAADSAQNAEKLDGFDAAELGFLDSYRNQDFEVGTTHPNSGVDGNPFEELVTRAVEVPADGFLFVTSEVFIAEEDGTDQTLASVTRLDWDPDVPVADQRENLIGLDLHSPGGTETGVGSTFTTAAGIAVSAGTHTVTLFTQGTDSDIPYITAGERLTTLFVPFGDETIVGS